MQEGRNLSDFCQKIIEGAAVTVARVNDKYHFYADGLPLCGLAGNKFGFATVSGGYDWVQAAVSRRIADKQDAAGLVAYLDKLERARLAAVLAGKEALADMLAAEVQAVQAMSGQGAQIDGGGANSGRKIWVEGGCAAY